MIGAAIAHGAVALILLAQLGLTIAPLLGRARLDRMIDRAEWRYRRAAGGW